MGSLSTEQFTRLHDGFELAGWVLALLIGTALLGQWFTNRELGHRRAVESARMQQEVQAAQREAAEVRRRLTPREVSPEQRSKLLAALGGSTGAVTMIYPADPETEIFAKRIASVLTAAGWNVSFEGSVTLGTSYGFVLTIRDSNTPPAHVVKLRSALEDAFGRPVPLRSQPSQPAAALYLTVGMKQIE